MTLTEKQESAIPTLRTSDNVLAYGGARSGKTYLLLAWIMWRATKYPGSRHLIARQFGTDIRLSIWKDTLQKVVRDLGMKAGQHYRTNEQEMLMTLANGSEIWCSGLDDKERVDKVLGREYVTEYLNETPDIPWSTVKTVRTRLSQKVDGCSTQFLADLNPTTIAHWTYKQWFLSIDPETKEPLHVEQGTWQKIQLNPIDNVENLAQGYIDRELSALSGSYRNRFLLGEYSSFTDIVVYQPRRLYSHWSDFDTWVANRWDDVRLTAGLDLGYQDADAFSILAYIDGIEQVWLVWEHKARRQGIAELADNIKRGLRWCQEHIPNRQSVSDIVIWTDTGTIRHGTEGERKKSAGELRRLFGINTRTAYKREKGLGIEILREDVNTGRLAIPANGPFADECEKIVWTQLPDGTIERVLNDDEDKGGYHPDSMFSILYPYRWLCAAGNSAMIGREKAVLLVADKTPEELRKDYDSRQLNMAREMLSNLEQGGVW